MKTLFITTAALAFLGTGAIAANGDSKLQRGTFFSGPHKGQMVVYDAYNPTQVWTRSDLAAAGVDIWDPQAVAAHTGLKLPGFQGEENPAPGEPGAEVTW